MGSSTRVKSFSSLPKVMRELCSSVGYMPAQDSQATRRKLLLKLGSAVSYGHTEMFADPMGKEWYRRAVEAEKRGRALPSFDRPKRLQKLKDLPARIIIREIIKNPDATSTEYVENCMDRGLAQKSRAYISVKKSECKRLLQVLGEEDCLNEKGLAVLNGKLLTTETERRKK